MHLFRMKVLQHSVLIFQLLHYYPFRSELARLGPMGFPFKDFLQTRFVSPLRLSLTCRPLNEITPSGPRVTTYEILKESKENSWNASTFRLGPALARTGRAHNSAERL